ncbi:MAG TPA: phosphoribosylformylglycinamidine synthase subunit PurS [Saprospiraceae bacterium]|nr:phosphoribosylformylglycinamidine synthase subunit PurS [Saprospiraceae bacterium]
MKFTAEIQIMPLPEVIEPQGRTLQKHIHQLPIEGIQRVRIGKLVQLEVQADSEQTAHDIVTKACEKLLVHPLIESYSFALQLKEEFTAEEAESEEVADHPEVTSEEE